jgi:hypothetical protein
MTGSSVRPLLAAVFVGSLTLWACAGHASSEDDATPSAASDLTAGSKLTLGQQSDSKKATGSSQKYTFDVEDGAAVDIDVDEAFVQGEGPLTDPPKDVTLTGPGGSKVDAQSTTFPGGGQANAGVELRASGLKAGTYTISYTGVVPHSYFVLLKGHNGTGINAPCDPKKGIRHNSVCGDSLRCDDSTSICAKPAAVGGFCDTEKDGDDVCTDGHTCVFDKATSQGDEGFNGRCK